MQDADVLTLQALRPGMRVHGIAETPVTIRAVEPIGSSAARVTYLDGDGLLAEEVLRPDDTRHLRAAGPAGRPFDADPEDWRLAAEALRIKYAAQHDPMLAVSTSDLDPLPHQLYAVYDALIPRTPLRFLLADDPGAGKTVMAGLYIKELLLRGALDRCLVVAPGSLVDQWQDELSEKFGLTFDVLTKDSIDAVREPGDVFVRHPRLIARMDQLARHDGLMDALRRTDFDLVVVDEAHRMSATWSGEEVKRTKRYRLGERLGEVARHLLLMTATPHSGKGDDFHLFLALLDPDRFEGRSRGRQTAHPGDLMRRMLKEHLLTMEGKPLFPERHASTVPYDLSAGEYDLYKAVTHYVRNEMGRADRLTNDKKRRNTVGFALQVLQRRLASSPEAILRSLERRRDRLRKRITDMEGFGPAAVVVPQDVDRTWDDDDIDSRLADMDAAETESIESAVLDAATAAQTVAELREEIAVLETLVGRAMQVRRSGADRKWTELGRILTDQKVTAASDGTVRKIIVFTEHRDTLNYLHQRIGDLLGDPDAVVTIHGAVSRVERRARTERFTQDRHVRVLVATDAAGEGLNLQRAHLMVNYDLPWNPNKIEQRFGRVHRIGQTETCHLWNLVAKGTREGDVLGRLLVKIEQQRQDYGGQVFDVLGEAFENRPLRDLLVEAIRYGDDPQVRARNEEVIDAAVAEGIPRLLEERALNVDVVTSADAQALAVQMERARARRLQPLYIRAFFNAAFRRLGGRIVARQAGRHEIKRVPASLRERTRRTSRSVPLPHYERVCFEQAHIRQEGQPAAELLAPGHPLLDAVVDATIDELGHVLERGAVLYDEGSDATEPRLLVATTEQIDNGHGAVVSRRFAYTELDRHGATTSDNSAPYLNYGGLPAGSTDAVTAAVQQEWLATGAEDVAVAWSTEHTLQEHEREVRASVTSQVDKTRGAVEARLASEINYWDRRTEELRQREADGKRNKIRPETAYSHARKLEDRRALRLRELELDARLRVKPPQVRGVALVIPAGMVTDTIDGSGGRHRTGAVDTEWVERRAVDAVLAAERALGAVPEEKARNHPGWDIRSVRQDGSVAHIEVKGRIAGSDDFTVTKTEVNQAKNLGDSHRLALVSVSPGPASEDEVRYVLHAFDDTDTDDFTTKKYVKDWKKLWKRGTAPL
ncbi:helicase-related protein [Myceligenerans crystallogenes]|uniref:Helicase-related protein n=1 Tax=Myceligenerans crystallogenes TaxID=316335 RepID=A0ABN2NMN2_9MICO